MTQTNNLDQLKSELMAEFEKKFLIHRRNGDVIPNLKRFKIMYVKSFLSSAIDRVTEKTAEAGYGEAIADIKAVGIEKVEKGFKKHILSLKRDKWLGRGK